MRIRKFSQTINAPLRKVYAWCTDFSLDSSDSEGSTSSRRVLAKTRTKCVFVDLGPNEGGSPKLTVNVVTLQPPDAWHLDLYGDPRNEIVDYKLKELGKVSTRLDMVFKNGLSPSERTWFASLWERWAAEIERESRSSNPR